VRTPQELDHLGDQAILLRRQGKSLRQIKEILGPISNSTLNQVLRDEPLPSERARPGYAESKARAAEGVRRYWAAEHLARETARTAITAAAAAQLGELTDREIIIAGAIAYWCEGSKSKPYRIDEQVRFINSDPALIRFFLAFLDRVGVPRQRLGAWRHDRRAACRGVTVRNARESAQLREHAVALRRAGKSVRQIKEILGPVGNRTLHDALRGEPPPAWTRRPNAKDDLRAKARELRRQGLDYEEIVGRLGVSKGSVSLWVRDLPRPPRVAAEECAERASERMRAYWTAERPVRAARRAAASAAAAATIGDLTTREILIAGAVAYWCEGAKNKPHRRVDRVTFTNSDPELISFFLLFLETAGVPRSEWAFQLQIHDTADVASAQRSGKAASSTGRSRAGPPQ
jgi:transcriptional regulator with XRE-family HTH domain